MRVRARLAARPCPRARLAARLAAAMSSAPVAPTEDADGPPRAFQPAATVSHTMSISGVASALAAGALSKPDAADAVRGLFALGNPNPNPNPTLTLTR